MRARHVALVCWLVAASAACGGPAQQSEATDGPSLDVTSWTEQTELFMEYPPLVAGRTTRFAVHLTSLADFKAMVAGRPHIEFTPASGGTKTTLPGTDALRPGAFRIEGPLPPAGRYRWALVVEAPGLTDRHDLGIATVFADDRSANDDAAQQPPDDPAAFSYLKEQQWTNAFGTERAAERELRVGLRAPATIEPLAGGDAMISAPAPGRFSADAPVSVGTSVEAGALLGYLEPRLSEGPDRATLVAEVAEARAAADAARAELARAERLLGERAVPARRVEEARRAVGVADARLQASTARLAQRDQVLGTGGGVASGNAFALRAPIAGRVVSVLATPGASYGEGTALFRIVRTDRLAVRVLLTPADAATVRDVTSLAFEAPGRGQPVALTPRRRHDTGVIDEATRAVPVQFEVDNPNGTLVVGESGTAVLYRQATARGLAVPRAAVLFEAGRPYVFVQTGGETFARRYLDVAAMDGEWVSVRDGIGAGDRVVTHGAYEVQLASASKGLPAEGHVH